MNNFITNIENDKQFDFDILDILFRPECFKLTDEQKLTVLKIIKYKKSLLTLEMGLGKTAVITAVATILLPKAIEENKLIIISAPASNISGFKTQFEYMYFKDRIQFITGERKDILKIKKLVKNEKVNLIFTQHSCWTGANVFDFNLFIYNNRDKIMMLAYDEAIEKNAKGFLTLIELCCHYVEYVIMATASLSGSVSSFKVNNEDVLIPIYNLAKSLSLITYMPYHQFLKSFSTKKTDKRKKTVEYVPNTDAIMNLFSSRIMNLSRHEIGIDTEFNSIKFIRSTPTEEMERRIKNTSDSFRRILYGEIDYINYNPNSVPALRNLITHLMSTSFEEYEKTNRIIFCNHRETTSNLKTLLINLGFNTYVINGELQKPEDKKRVEDEFNNSSNSIVITNITKGINLGSAREIISLSIPDDLMQFIARSTRGYVKGNIDLTIIYYPKYEDSTIKACRNMIHMNNSSLNRGHTHILDEFDKELSGI